MYESSIMSHTILYNITLLKGFYAGKMEAGLAKGVLQSDIIY